MVKNSYRLKVVNCFRKKAPSYWRRLVLISRTFLFLFPFLFLLLQKRLEPFQTFMIDSLCEEYGF